MGTAQQPGDEDSCRHLPTGDPEPGLPTCSTPGAPLTLRPALVALSAALTSNVYAHTSRVQHGLTELALGNWTGLGS